VKVQYAKLGNKQENMFAAIRYRKDHGIGKRSRENGIKNGRGCIILSLPFFIHPFVA
jgi:hypothetical protein